MSDPIKHECGIAMIRLLKPLSFYQEKYGSPFYGLKKLYILMEKQHNRGQDGAGIASIKLDPQPGRRYISRKRSIKQQPIKDIFSKVFSRLEANMEKHPELLSDPEEMKQQFPYMGELLLGHLRYGTHGENHIESCHPFLRQNNWMSRNLVLAGNFNFTNVDAQFDQLVQLGQHPKEKADTVLALEKIGHFLDEENIRLFYKYKPETGSNIETNKRIQENLDMSWILKKSAAHWDGGFTIAGLVGHGDSFVLRDPNGIRPCFYYQDDEVVVVTSERPAIMTAFDVPAEEVKPLAPGSAMVIKKNGGTSFHQILRPGELKQCSFERIYFSRGNDKDIYKERKQLGRLLVPQVLESIEGDIRNTVFSFIPNTAETAFYGLIEGVEDHLAKQLIEKLQNKPSYSPKELEEMIQVRPRVEKAAIKDVKMRTFITDDQNRDDLVSHVYDISYGILKENVDNLVVLDDSIVRGTTLRRSILQNLDRLNPKKIVIVSSAPQIRFPDCYGIDMSRMKNFVAFRAAVSLIEERNMEELMEEVYHACKARLGSDGGEFENLVKRIYEPFTPDEISDRIADLVKPPGMRSDLKVIYQSLENLHAACPDHAGDWYFSGDFPTEGGSRVSCQAFVNYMEKSEARAY